MITQPSQPAPVPEAFSLQELSRRLAREMRIAAAIADDCQDALGEDARLMLDHETAIRLQGLDLLSQQLIEIGRVLDRLSHVDAEVELSTALADLVCLSDLKRRLVDGAAPTVPALTSHADLW